MKIDWIRNVILTSVLLIVANNSVKAQVFTGFTAFKELIEYEGQRYLMEDIYQITSDSFDKLKIDKTIKEVDNDEGFMFVLTSYVFNEKKGVVITSFNSTSFSNNRHQFVNVNLTNQQYEELYNLFKELGKNGLAYNEHILKKFNDRLIVDVSKDGGGIISYILWVDNYSRHTFSTTKWDRAHKRHLKFVE